MRQKTLPLISAESLREERVAYEVERVEKSLTSYQNVYWFARALVGSEYGSVGSDTTQMLHLGQAIATLLSVPNPKIGSCKNAVWGLLRGIHRSGTQAASKIEKLIEYLDPLIGTCEDLEVLKFTIDHIIVPTNILLRRVPSSDKEVAERMIRGYLAEEGEAGLKDVILMWDRTGRRWCMETERVVVVAGFRLLRETLDDLLRANKFTQMDADQTLTAFVQEFERRLVRGVRPGRAGRSLEDVTGVILDHFGIKGFADAPEHIKTVFEVDKMIPLPDGWRIGVSCKRTLRERWKQSASLNEQRLDAEKIRSTLHVITYTSDLTVPKIKAIGESRGIVYIPDDDHFLRNHGSDPEVLGYIRPMTAFISDLRKATQQPG